MNGLDALRAVARYQTHGGYVWSCVMSDGGLICEKCASEPENYRLMLRATKHKDADGWQVIGLTHSGEWEEYEECDHCGRVLCEWRE